MVALEAMACGVPVIASKAGALPELVDETVGRLVDPLDESTLAGAIERSLADESMMQACLTSGPAAARRYEWGEVVRRLLAVINSQ
jgi:glycosyltransferase involved in cell wall biosynthesis